MSSDYNVTIRKPAAKFLAKQTQSTRKRIFQAIDGLKRIPPEGDITLMRGVYK